MSLESVAVKEYIYNPINSSNQEIRLVTIKAGREEDPVECFLTHVSLSDKPQYEALSYVWGNPNSRSQIILEGCDFSVTSNLGTALPYLRLPEANRTMWIDAICIDQSNLAERESQVQLMRSIYQEAKQVVSWMNSPEAEDVSVHTASLLREGEDNNFSTSWLQGVILSEMQNVERIVGITRFCTTRYRYWTRIWITQEVALAREGVVQWKKTVMPYKSFVEFSRTLSVIVKDREWLSKHVGLKHASFLQELSRMLKRNDIIRRIAPGAPLLDLLRQNQYKSATDPRDKVYALLGLSDMAPNSHEGLIVNYGKDWSKRDVYTGVVRAVVHKTSRLEIICDAQPHADILETNSSSDNQELELPSWAPDWSAETSRPFSSTMNSRIGAAGLTAANVEFYDDKNIMKAQGICVGTVGAYGRCLQAGVMVVTPKAVKSCEEIFREWLELCRNFAGDNADTLDAFCRTITLGFGAPTALKNLMAGTNQRSDPSDTPSLPAAIYFPSLHRPMRGCRLFTIDPMKDCLLPREAMPFLIGIGPKELQEKDVICVLAGCKFSVALRPDGNRFRFVRPVFVDGLWDGQAIEGVETGLYSWDWFEMH